MNRLASCPAKCSSRRNFSAPKSCRLSGASAAERRWKSSSWEETIRCGGAICIYNHIYIIYNMYIYIICIYIICIYIICIYIYYILCIYIYTYYVYIYIYIINYISICAYENPLSQSQHPMPVSTHLGLYENRAALKLNVSSILRNY